MTTTSVDSTDVSTLLAAADGTRTSLTIENTDSGMFGAMWLTDTLPASLR